MNTKRLFIIVLSFALLGIGDVASQTPSTIPVIVIGLEFPLTSSTGTMSQHREFASSNVQNQTDSYGTRRVFTNAVTNAVFGTTNSVSDYFVKNSYNGIILENAGVFGPYQAVEAADHYWATREDPCEHGWKDGHRERRTEAINAFIAEEINNRKSFNLAQYDADNDGTVNDDELVVVVVFPQTGLRGFARGAMVSEGSKDPFTVGSISWDLYGNDDGVDEVFLSDFAQNGVLGLIAHEMAHIIIDAGDQYEDSTTIPNTTPPGWDYTEPGPFSLMDNDGFHSHLDPLHKIHAGGWVTPIEVTKDGYYNIRAVESYADIYRLADPASHSGEYFIVENRQHTNYDNTLPSTGLAIWHIDESRLDNYRTAVEMEPAIGITNPIQYANYLWPCTASGCAKEFWNSSSPLNTRWHDNSLSYIGVWEIPTSSSSMRVYLDVPGAGILVKVTPEQLQLSPNKSSTFTIKLVNTGSSTDDFALTLSNLDNTWYSLSSSKVQLTSYQKTSVTVTVTLPQCAEEGSYSFTVKAASVTTPSVTSSDGAQLIVKAADATLAKDTNEPNNSTATATNVSLSVGNTQDYNSLTLHDNLDVDYFFVSYQINVQDECFAGSTQKSFGSFAGAFRPEYTPGSLSITIDEEFCRAMDVDVYDSGGKLFKKYSVANSLSIECPTQYFTDQKLYVAIKSNKGKSMKYDVSFGLSQSYMTVRDPLTDIGRVKWPTPPEGRAFDPKKKYFDWKELVQDLKTNYPQFKEYRGRIEAADFERTLGQVAQQAGSFKEAENYFRQSLAIYQESGYSPGEALATNSLGEVLAAQNNVNDAQAFFERALTLHLNMNDHVGAANDLTWWGRHLLEQRQLQQAIPLFQQALPLLQQAYLLQKEVMNSDGMVLNLLAQSDAFIVLGNSDAAVACLLMAKATLPSAKDQHLAGLVQQHNEVMAQEMGNDRFNLIQNRVSTDAEQIRYQAIVKLKE